MVSLKTSILQGVYHLSIMHIYIYIFIVYSFFANVFLLLFCSVIQHHAPENVSCDVCSFSVHSQMWNAFKNAFTSSVEQREMPKWGHAGCIWVGIQALLLYLIDIWSSSVAAPRFDSLIACSRNEGWELIHGTCGSSESLESAEMVSSLTVWHLASTRTWCQDDVISEQTASSDTVDSPIWGHGTRFKHSACMILPNEGLCSH